MKAPRSIEDYLNDIVGHADLAMTFLKGLESAAAMARDPRTFLAAVRALEVIGEAARHIPPEARAKYPTLPWRGMTGMRDKVIHDYFGVDPEVVWRTIREDLPPLREAVARILQELPSEPGSGPTTRESLA